MSRKASRLTDSADGWKAAEVDADADRYAACLCLADNRLHLLTVPYVARVQPEAVHARLQRFERKLVVEVDIGDEGNGDLPSDLSEGFSRLHIGYGGRG